MKLYWLSLIAFGLFSGRFVYADDTEIYRSTTGRINPNVVFVFDTSGSMIADTDGDVPAATGKKSRLDITKQASKKAIQNLYAEGKGVNLTILRFTDMKGDGGTTAEGGYLLTPALDISKATNFNLITNAIDSLHGAGGTPMTESVYEAALFLLGKQPVYGNLASGSSYERATARYAEYCSDWKWKWGERVCVQFSYQYGHDYDTVNNRLPNSPSSIISGGNYISPVTDTCQSNHIVLFTDGLPSSDKGVNGKINGLIKNMSNLPSDLDKDCSGSGGCAEELAYWLQHTDHFTDSKLTGVNDPNAKETDQPIYVHTVGGFNVNDAANTMLKKMAEHGNGIYQKADDEDKLAKALDLIFRSISDSAGNFAAPVVAVNAFNSLEHRDELYYSVFKPSERPGWSGNIKRYRMNSSGQILDVNGDPAIDSSTGFFKDTAKSYWTVGDADGSKVTSGGIAKHLPAGRKVITKLSGTGEITDLVNESNISTSMLSGLLPSTMTLTSADRTEILQWAQGLDPTATDPLTTARGSMADPLHGNPILVTYKEGDTLTDVLFSGNNAGYLQAINPDENTPGEYWAYIPKELLPNLAVYQKGISKYLKVYGLDGPLSLSHLDTNANRVIESGETAYLAAGMRRGGSSYYLLDISKKTAPKLVSQINSGDSGFEELGQTWSKMISATVMWKGVKTPVFFFGGGYDTDEDNAKTRITHDKGNAVYMVKATTDSKGKAFDLLWKATGRSTNNQGLSLSGMKSSFAGDLTLVDNDGNGTVDLIYAADVGGRIWRFDIDSSNTSANNFATGGIIADFNNGTESGNIRFYTQPDVVYTDYGLFETVDPSDPTNVIAKKEGRYQIAIGSGFRAGPLSTSVKDKIFVINDFDTASVPASGYSKKSVTDLANYKNFSSASYSQIRNGFYYELTRSGEKVLSTTLTVNNVIYIPTFRPSDSTVNIGCEPDTGQASLIKIEPLISPQTTERKVTTTDLNQGGIVPKPILVFPPADPTTKKPSEPVIAIGTEITPVSGNFNAFQQTYWKEN